MKQFFSYFKIPFIVIGVLAVLLLCVGLTRQTTGERLNYEAPEQRVYDYADVLSDKEEEKLEELIARRESQIACDLVLVTINESVLAKYGFTENSNANWEYCITRYADDFYDQNNYGYDKVHGDGALLLDNWYEGEYGSEKGTHFSTCGRVYEYYTDSMVDEVLDDVYYNVDDSPYMAYRMYIEDVYEEMSGSEGLIRLNVFPLLIVALVVAGIFVGTHLKTREGDKTTTSTTYVENNSVKFNVQKDELVNKYVTSRVIPRNTGSSGGSSGRSGGHRSSGGVSHGGGSRRR